ncbi:MerR family transcriptional regulator [Methylosinus sp. Ce-a6]|uniref:MerR family transcriptional regulator n=1 Tax=Methylosinus sp. Ce-a6 TaxID=2172005 RepID=UPI001357772A|nr:MerR family transcriptional regulator [Methylosinus sp. Ce-a6]
MTAKSDGAFRTIGEVAESLDLPPHVLRFWETRFSEIEPVKRAGGRRYYRPRDVELVAAIRHLLYGRGYTIKGVQRLLREQGARAVIESARGSGAAIERAERDADFDERERPSPELSLFSHADAPARREEPPPVDLREIHEAAEEIHEERETEERGAATTLVALAPREPPPMLTLPAVRLSEAPTGGLRSQDERLLRQALADLAECRRMLELTRR